MAPVAGSWYTRASYTANIRCMSPPDALPVPLVGSKPLASDGISTVRVPPLRGGSAGWVDGGAVPGGMVPTPVRAVVVVVALPLTVGAGEPLRVVVVVTRAPPVTVLTDGSAPTDAVVVVSNGATVVSVSLLV